ncbi:MAG: tRNA dihydrouridine(20/20a) synthase DusA [Xanthomonadales bacterium]|nr:tRNA dihydrouridine(20/20a) synthase DusA [Xanthomonadales bacterium]
MNIHQTSSADPWLLSVAPMMDWTDRHCRYFHRLLSPNARLYTEMVTSPALIHGDRERLLGFDRSEHPLALQLGGSDPVELAAAAQIGEQYGYDEINLNVGCPSDRVQSGRFGACLMREPDLVADCFVAMRDAVSIPVTIKCRLGVDGQDEYADLQHFIETVAAKGCTVFVVHARKAWLKGLSPKENRDVPPLNYERVYQLKREFPGLKIVINGGIDQLADVQMHLQYTDGVMLGRTAYHEPFRLAELEHALYGTSLPTREELVERMRPYVESHLVAGGKLQHISRHMLGLFQGLPGARSWRRHLSENAHQGDAGMSVIDDALQLCLRQARSRAA